MLAQPTLLPGSESGGFGQDDVASPVFLAWSKLDRAGLLLDQTLATLAPIACRALSVTGRAVPEALRDLVTGAHRFMSSQTRTRPTQSSKASGPRRAGR